jgi:hypothetical protein
MTPFQINAPSKNQFMKAPSAQPTDIPQTPVFPKTLHRLRAKPGAAMDSKSKKRENVFSRSRDTREDRGARQMKTSQNPQTFTQAR